MLSLASKAGGDSPSPRRGTRITPRTCLWPLAGSLTVTFALSIGLTFLSDHHCYAGTCGEWLFPLQARLHVVIWYAWISASVTFLAVRSFHPRMQKFLGRSLVKRDLILVHKPLTVGGAVLLVWVIALYGIVVAVWWIRLRDYFVGRGETSGIFRGSNKLAAIALTGHFCDITMGMVLIPISRHSALASFFKLSPSTTLTNHMLTAYTLFSLVLIHGFLYVSWIPDFNSLSESLRRVIPILNPTYQYLETWPGSKSTLGVWRASLIFTGSVSAIIMLLIFITTLPRIRSKYFNLFYFTHFLTIIMVIIICLHASTMFYCTAPGLCMWFLDWGMRFHELRRVLPSEITTIGNEWYCITVPLPRSRLTGCSCKSPLAHFYIHHAGSSIRELHPFTTITPLAAQNASTPTTDDDFPIQFLFRKRGISGVPKSFPEPTRFCSLTRIFQGKKGRVQSTQWTDRLAGLVDQQQVSTKDLTVDSSVTEGPAASSEKIKSKSFPNVNISLRLEGPYFSPADPSHHKSIICLVAGTGISGAIAIANAFAFSHEQEKSEAFGLGTPKIHARRCVIIWSVKANNYIEMPFSGLEMETHLTGPGRPRLDMQEAIRRATSAEPGSLVTDDGVSGKKTWVYISGPKPFMDAGKKACEAVEGVDVYAPSWDI